MPNILIARFVSVISVLLFNASAGLAAEPSASVTGKTECYEQCRLEIDLIGKIDQSTVMAVQRLVDEAYTKAGAKGLHGSLIHLNSSGGSVEAALKIGRIIRKERMFAATYPDDICASACVLGSGWRSLAKLSASWHS
jgi:membrane-bound ClpP family serine protease